MLWQRIHSTDNTVNASVDYDIDFYATGGGSFQQKNLCDVMKSPVYDYSNLTFWLRMFCDLLWHYKVICEVIDIWKKKYPLLTNSLWLSPDKINAELNNGFQRDMLLIFDLKFVFNLLKILYLHTLFMKMSKALNGWRIWIRTKLT